MESSVQAPPILEFIPGWTGFWAGSRARLETVLEAGEAVMRKTTTIITIMEVSDLEEDELKIYYFNYSIVVRYRAP